MTALAPTAIDPTVRFEPSEVSKFVYLPDVADKTSPTAAEITAGTDLSNEVSDWDGWSVSSDMIDTPDLGTSFTSQIGGRTKADTSTITFYEDKTGADVRSILPRGTTGFVLKADGGLVTASKADVYPVTVTSVGKTTKIGDASTVVVSFAITGEPAEDVAIPAAT